MHFVFVRLCDQMNRNPTQWSTGDQAFHIAGYKVMPGFVERCCVADHCMFFYRWNFIQSPQYEVGHGRAHGDHSHHFNFRDAPLFVLKSPQFNIVSIQAGAWDATWGCNATDFEESLRINVNRALQNKRHVVLVTQTPEGHACVGNNRLVYGHNHTSLTDATIELNSRIQSVGREFALNVVDAWAMVKSDPSHRRPEFWQNGAGWHMNEPSAMSSSIGIAILDAASRSD